MPTQVSLKRTEGAQTARLVSFVEPESAAVIGAEVETSGKKWVIEAVYATIPKERLAWWLKIKKVAPTISGTDK